MVESGQQGDFVIVVLNLVVHAKPGRLVEWMLRMSAII